MSTEHVMSVQGLRKTFPDGTEALRGVDIDVRPGEKVVLLGHNGSGKSTLMRCALGLEPVTRGRVLLHGVDTAAGDGRSLRRARRRTGAVFQNINLVNGMSVLSNVVHGALGQGGPALRYWSHRLARPEVRERALDCLDRVGLANLASRRSDQLSGGQRQRVALARALMQEPDLILADEPVASLDPRAGHQVMELLMDIAAEHRMTVVCTLHQLEFALGHSERIVGLRAGRLVLDRATADVDRGELTGLYAEEEHAAEALVGAGDGDGAPPARAGSGLPSKWGIVHPREMNPMRRIRGFK